MSEVKSKGIVSLRKKKPTTKRPTISAPRQIVTQHEGSSTTSLQPPPLHSTPSDDASRSGSQSSAVPRPRPRHAVGGPDRTADLVKRRYSTRFANHPQDAERAPSIPSLPAHLVQARHGRSPDRRGERIKIDVNALRDPNLQTDKYIAHILKDASEADINQFHQDLAKLKNRTSTDLQYNVYQNRTQFIKISNEADKLKTEMHTLRALMSELTAVLGHATSAGTSQAEHAAHQDRKRSNRSSVANLEALWSTHLQAMWKRVEGSQKFLPAVPGRHIVYESGRWVELNAATWKPRRRVHVILLNDHLLLASEKKRLDPSGLSPNLHNRRASVYHAQAQTQLIAERCWPLQDLQMSDISTRSSDDRKHISTALNIRVGSESWTVASSSASDGGQEATALLVHFRKAVEDMRKTMVDEQDHRGRAMDELAHLTGQSRFYRKAASAHDLNADTLARSSTLIDVDGKQQTLRWVETQIDTLDLNIALQHFDDAVALSEKLRKLARNIKGNNVAQEIILLKIDQRATKLSNMLAKRLRNTNAGAVSTKENVGWLVRLGFEETARAGYLDARKEGLRKRARQIPFTGSLPPHLTALSYVTFTIILHTFRTFSSSFPPTSSSAVVKWAKERIDEFNQSLERQLSSVERGSPLWNDCITVVQQQAAILNEVNVDFSGLIAQGLTQS